MPFNRMRFRPTPVLGEEVPDSRASSRAGRLIKARKGDRLTLSGASRATRAIGTFADSPLPETLVNVDRNRVGSESDTIDKTSTRMLLVLAAAALVAFKGF